jgi:hypothetical protein
MFYKINKLQTVRFELVAIERRVEDPMAPTGAYQRIPLDTAGRVTVLPQFIPATMKNRLDIEQMARISAAELLQVKKEESAVTRTGTISHPGFATTLRDAALEAVDKDLADAGILDIKTGKPTETIVAELSLERNETLPTPGILVKGYLDKCNTCEPALQKGIELDLEHKQLENEMLKRQTELLDKSQEYRCCPGGSDETEEPSDD